MLILANQIIMRWMNIKIKLIVFNKESSSKQ